MLSTKKSLIEKYLSPLVKPLSRINPNVLTLLGSIPPLLFFVFVITGNYVWALIALIGSAIDMLDGMVARKYGKVTVFGGFLDSTIDRIADFLIITAFAFAVIVRWELAAPLILYTFLTSYVRSRGESASKHKVNFAVGIMERTERLIGLFFALLVYIIWPTLQIQTLNTAEIIFVFLNILSAITVVQRIAHAYKHL